MMPAIVAASASVTLLMSFPKKSRAASATPAMENDPRWPSGMSFRYISRISSFEARLVRMSDTHTSRIFRLIDLARADCRLMPSNFGRKTLRTSCCVMVLPPAVYARFPRRFDTSAPTMPIGSIPGCS